LVDLTNGLRRGVIHIDQEFLYVPVLPGIEQDTGTILRRSCPRYFRTYMPKFSYGESPHGILLMSSGNESLYSSIRSMAPTEPSSSILYYVSDSIPLWKLHFPLIISICVVTLFALIIASPRNWISKIKKLLFKRYRTLSMIYNKTTVFYPKPLVLPLNIAIGFVVSLAVAQITNSLVAFADIHTRLVCLSSLLTLVLVVVDFTEREMVWKTPQILNSIKKSLTNSDEFEDDIENLVGILSTINESDPPSYWRWPATIYFILLIKTHLRMKSMRPYAIY
ncbi:MAG: hypothetical protein ACQET3_12100, partial [Promethearchaeati archaeon]